MDASEEVYCHTRLKTSSSIRILELEPALDREAEVAVKLSEVALDSDQKYEALSYVWGDHKTMQQILCNGKAFQVTSNCKAPLQRLRLCNETRTLWIDAICIYPFHLKKGSMLPASNDNFIELAAGKGAILSAPS
jgi:Heterokaryon incompatibility protein (HET)